MRLDDQLITHEALDVVVGLGARWPEPRALDQTTVVHLDDQGALSLRLLDGDGVSDLLRLLELHAEALHEVACCDDEATTSSAMEWALDELGVPPVHAFTPDGVAGVDPTHPLAQGTSGCALTGGRPGGRRPRPWSAGRGVEGGSHVGDGLFESREPGPEPFDLGAGEPRAWLDLPAVLVPGRRVLPGLGPDPVDPFAAGFPAGVVGLPLAASPVPLRVSGLVAGVLRAAFLAADVANAGLDGPAVGVPLVRAARALPCLVPVDQRLPPENLLSGA